MTIPNADTLGDLEHRIDRARDLFNERGDHYRTEGDAKLASAYEWVAERLEQLYDELEEVTNEFINDTKEVK